MRVVVQRVSEASCTVEGNIVSKIKDGYMLLVGFETGDTVKEVEYLAKKIANLRIFEDEDGKLNKSILDMKYEILSISQFTLYGDARKGNRPSFTRALDPVEAEKLYIRLTEILIDTYMIPTYNGVFGAMMDIALVNSGPVTIILESK
jgi:D-tyrosyl-tRNA(Tyr) deacylase